MTISTPTLLNGIMNPYFCCPKQMCSNRLQNTSKAISIFLYLITLVLLLCFVYVVSTKGNGASPDNALIITAFVTFLLSIGFWENLSGFHFERLNKRPLLMSLLSIMKFFTMCVTFLLTFLVMGVVKVSVCYSMEFLMLRLHYQTKTFFLSILCPLAVTVPFQTP